MISNEKGTVKKRIIFGVLTLIFALAGSLFSYYLDRENKELGGKLNIHIWEDYMSEIVIKEFENEFSVEVNIVTYGDEDEGVENMEKNSGEYDLVVLSDSLMGRMIDGEKLARLSKKRIPNFRNLDDEFLNKEFDKDNSYSIPYNWGVTGLVINTKFVKEDVRSWSIFWNEKYAGKMSMLDNMSEVFAATLFYYGSDRAVIGNSKEFYGVKNLLLPLRKNLRGFESEATISESLLGEDIWAGHLYNDSAALLIQEDNKFKFVLPEEGGVRWVDYFVIPKEVKNKRTAEVFLNYLLRPEVAAKNSVEVGALTCNEIAQEFLDDEYKKGGRFYVEEGDLDWYKSLSAYYEAYSEGEQEKLWEELRK